MNCFARKDWAHIAGAHNASHAVLFFQYRTHIPILAMRTLRVLRRLCYGAEIASETALSVWLAAYTGMHDFRCIVRRYVLFTTSSQAASANLVLGMDRSILAQEDTSRPWPRGAARPSWHYLSHP